MANNWLHLNDQTLGFRAFRTWKACANFVFEHNLESYFIVEESTGFMLVHSYRGEGGRRFIILDPEHLPPASVIPFL